MVNILSNDVNRFDLAVLFLHYLWAGPLQLAIVVALTWPKLGPSTMAGALLLIVFVPLQSKIKTTNLQFVCLFLIMCHFRLDRKSILQIETQNCQEN